MHPRNARFVGLCAVFISAVVPALWACAARTDGDRVAPASTSAPAGLPMQDLGSHRHPISTEDPAAQAYFDQGLVLVYGFNHAQAIRAFEAAAELDPECAMCFWGIAYAYGPNINAPMGPEGAAAAWAALEKAQALAPGANAPDQAYIAALSKRYVADPANADRAVLDRAYAEAMGEVVAAYPDDLDAATLHAEAMMDLNPWNHWTKSGEPVAETPQIVATLESVMARNPEHPGANHLYIHAIEASPDPSKGEAAADRLGALVPDSGHLVHMPSHIYLRVGRYEDALEINQRAAASDERYFAWCRSQGLYRAAYYPHNVHFLWAAAMIEGRGEIAKSSGRKVAAAIPDEILVSFPFVEEFRAIPLVTGLRFGEWDSVLGEPKPREDLRYVTGIWHLARAYALVRMGRDDEAEPELTALAAIAEEPAMAEMVFPGGSAASLLTLGRLHVEGERAANRGDVDGAVATLEQAVVLQDGLPYTEPPPYWMPTRQALGAVLLEAGRNAEAAEVLRADLKQYPKNGWALSGLARSLAAEGDPTASAVQQGFENAWARADVAIEGPRL